MSFHHKYAGGDHRKTFYTELALKVDPNEFDPSITPDADDDECYWRLQGMHCLPALLDNGEWWIVPAHACDEHDFLDQGPFKSVEQAVVFCNLMDNT